MKLVRVGFWLLVSIPSLVIFLWTLHGPFKLLVPVNSPVNAECCFSLAVILLMVVRSGSGRMTPGLHGTRSGMRGWIGIPALILLTVSVFWQSTRFNFLSDDFVAVKHACTTPQLTFSTLFATAGGDGFYRPIGNLSMVWTAGLAHLDPTSWHVPALILHVANALLVFALALRLGFSPCAAFFAGAFFALHGAHPEAAVWISGRFDLLATFFVLGGLVLFAASDAERTIKNRLCVSMSLLCMTLAILSKESAYVFPLLLALYIFSQRDRSLREAFVLIPFFIVAAVLFAYRLILFHGIGGYVDVATGRSQALTIHVLQLFKVLLLRLWAVLFFPVNWSIQPDMLFACLISAYMLSLIWMASGRSNRKHLLFSLGFVLAAALPPVQQLLIGSDMEKSRLLYLPSAGFCLMLAQAADRLGQRLLWRVSSIILVFSLFTLRHNLNIWKDTSVKAAAACQAAANCIGPDTRVLIVAGLPKTLHGVYFFANGFRECVQMRRGWAPFPIELLQEVKPAEVENGASLLRWDPSASQLDCLGQR